MKIKPKQAFATGDFKWVSTLKKSAQNKTVVGRTSQNKKRGKNK